MSKRAHWIMVVMALGGAACNLPAMNAPGAQRMSVAPAGESLTPSFTPLLPETPFPTSTSTPYGCQRPSDDYTRITLPGDFQLNQRTIEMLEYAQTLYEGTHDLLKAITQGSYNQGVDASCGTHDSGGAVDLSLRDLTNWNVVLYDEADDIILALRRAGFAAWVRDTDELYPGSPVHVHAIAVGDAELSEAAQSQLTGPEGYFRGMNGLPENIQMDRHGGPIVCPW